MAAGDKRYIRFKLSGRVEVTDELNVPVIMEQLGKLKTKAEEFSEAVVDVSMPRLTRVRL